MVAEEENGVSTPLASAGPRSAARSVAMTETPDEGDTVGCLPSEFRSPAPAHAPVNRVLNSRLSISKGEAVDEV